jgi:hypothetical protein
MYGFSKIRHNEGDNVYTNENFKRDEKEELSKIKRKINQGEREDKVALYNEDNFSKELLDLKMKQTNLESLCKQLINQNRCILEENTMMMKRLKTEEKEKNSKL